jgi:hypothetical protein
MLKFIVSLFTRKPQTTPPPQFAPGSYEPQTDVQKRSYLESHIAAARERFHEFPPEQVQRLNSLRHELSKVRAEACGLDELSCAEKINSFIEFALGRVDIAFARSELRQAYTETNITEVL